jgi:hypothetical protein
MIQKTLYTPYFAHKVFKEIIYLKRLTDDQMKLELIKGEC